MGTLDHVAYHALMSTRQLASDEDRLAFLAAVGDLPSDLSEADLADLWLVFVDGSNEPQAMFQLLHRMEKAPVDRLAASFLRAMSSIWLANPWWTHVFVIRFPNNDSAREELAQAARHATEDQREELINALAMVSKRSDAVAGLAAAFSEALRSQS